MSRASARIRSPSNPQQPALWRAQHPGENFALRDSVLKDLLTTTTQGTNVLAELSAKLASGVYDVATAGSGVSGLALLRDKTLVFLRNRDRKGSVTKRGLNPEAMTVREMEAELVPLLAEDLAQWLDDQQSEAVCLALDGFERIQSTILAEDIQKYFADWCWLLTDPHEKFAERFACVFLGRNENRWDDLYKRGWQTRISEHCVGGLGEADAQKFIESAAADHKDRGDKTTADNLRAYSAAILSAACEQYSQDKSSSFHPYYLDLAYGIVCDEGVRFQPADLGQTPAELQVRFLRYLQTGHREVFEAFRCLALAGCKLVRFGVCLSAFSVLGDHGVT